MPDRYFPLIALHFHQLYIPDLMNPTLSILNSKTSFLTVFMVKVVRHKAPNSKNYQSLAYR